MMSEVSHVWKRRNCSKNKFTDELLKYHISNILEFYLFVVVVVCLIKHACQHFFGHYGKQP